LAFDPADFTMKETSRVPLPAPFAGDSRNSHSSPKGSAARQVDDAPKAFDVIGFGYAAVDDLLYVDAYPSADAKVKVRRRERQCGGLTATALVAAARLGSRCAYAGALGDDEHSRFVLERFREEAVDVTHVRRQADARPVRSTIIVDQSRHTRTILYDTAGVIAADSIWPREDLIRSARVLLVDNSSVEGMIRAARIARDAHMPVVADLERSDVPLFSQLLALIDHLILSRDFALKLTGCHDVISAIKTLGVAGRRAVVVTCGSEGCWYASDDRPNEPLRQPAPPVESVDTTGCGDVFHGAYAAALVHGLDIPAAVRFATVAASLKATRCGGQSGIPSRSAVESQIVADESPSSNTTRQGEL
jgi:sulfofructose kinase